MGKSMSVRHQVLIALVAAYLSLFKQFYWVFKPFNYYGTVISGTYFLLVAAAIIVVAAIFVMIRWGSLKLLGRFVVGRRLIDVATCWALVFIVMKLAIDTVAEKWFVPASVKALLFNPVIQPLIYLVIPLVVVWFALKLVKRGCVAIYSIVSPLLLIFVVYSLNHTFVVNKRFTMSPPAELLEAGAKQKQVPPGRKVFLFIFDEWSYGRTFGSDDTTTVPMPALAQLRSRGVTWHKAYSPGPETLVSMPRFLFQPDAAIQKLDYLTTQGDVHAHRTFEGRSLFDLAGDGWHKAVVGFWLDYAHLLGDRLDQQVSYPLKLAIGPLHESLVELLGSQREWLRCIGLNRWNVRWVPKVSCAQTALKEPAFALIRALPENAMVLFHMGLPHLPSKDVWNDRIPSLKYADETSVPGYMGNLKRLDAMIGEFMTVMSDAGVLDDSLIIMTSDHAWRFDPATPGYDAVQEDPEEHSIFKHVPLVVTGPGVGAGTDVRRPVSTADLYPLIDAYIHGRPMDSAMAGLVDSE